MATGVGRAARFAAVLVVAAAVAVPVGVAVLARPETVGRAGDLPAYNLVANPSFETGLTGWLSWHGTATRVPAGDAPDGDYVAQVQPSDSSGGGYTLDDWPGPVTDTTAGMAYRATAWVKGSADNAGQPLQLVVREHDPAGNEVDHAEATVWLEPSGYQQVTVAFTAYDSGNALDVYFARPGGTVTPGESFTADAVSLTTIPTDNAVGNASFESGTRGWDAWHGKLAVVAASDAPDGSHVAAVGPAGHATGYTLDDWPGGVGATAAGVGYYAHAWVRANAAATGQPLRIVLREHDAAGRPIADASTTVTLQSTDYVPVYTTLRARRAGDYLDVYLERPAGTVVAGDGFYADAITVTDDMTLMPRIVPRTAPEIGNSMRGQYLWDGSPADPPSMPDPDVYYRDELSWRALEPAKGRFDFSVIDKGLRAAAARGGRFGFRILAYCPGCSSLPVDAAPGWIPTDPANPQMVRWNSPAFLAEWGRLMHALGKKYDHDPRLGWVDIGGYGNWGEWHLYRQAGTPITEANMKTLVQDVVDAFPDKTLLAMTSNDVFLSDAMSMSPNIGIRVDCLGATGLAGSSLGHDPVPPDVRSALQRWRTRPFVTEWCNGNDGGSSDEYANAVDQVAEYHVSMLSSGNYPTRYAHLSRYDQAQFMTANKTSGFRYQLDSLTLPSVLVRGRPAALLSTWENVNVAPTYDRWAVSYLLRDSSGATAYRCDSTLELRALLPTQGKPRQLGDTCTPPTSLRPGRYTLAVQVSDPSGYLAPMNLAIAPRGGDGSYRLGTVIVQ